MGLKRIKISELTLADSLKGLYTIGVKLVNGVQTSVKVSLEHIQTAYENAVTATNKANQAATNANNSRLQIEKNESTRQSNESARVSAESERASAETQRQTAEEERESNEVIRQQQEAEREQALKKYLPLTGGTMSGALTVESNVFLKSSSTTRYLQIATVNNSGVAFTSRLYVDANAGRGAFLQFINNGVAYELGVFTDGGPRYIKDGTIYMLYHAGNLGIATESKAGLVKSGNDVAVNGDGTLTVRNAATASIKDQAGGWTLRDFVDEILGIISGGDGDDMSAAINNLRSSLAEGQANLAAFVGQVNAFLNDAGASSGVIDSWKEIESFLAGITDTETLTGLLADTLASAKSYADGKTANSVTMASNAGATGRVLVSAAANKTAKDSGVALSDLAKKSELPGNATGSSAGLMSADDKTKLDGIAAGANKYVLPVASSSALGGVKSGGNITVAADGAVTVNKAKAADNCAQATKAMQDGNGATIAATYLKASAVTDVTEYAEITI